MDDICLEGVGFLFCSVEWSDQWAVNTLTGESAKPSLAIYFSYDFSFIMVYFGGCKYVTMDTESVVEYKAVAIEVHILAQMVAKGQKRVSFVAPCTDLNYISLASSNLSSFLLLCL